MDAIEHQTSQVEELTESNKGLRVFKGRNVQKEINALLFVFNVLSKCIFKSSKIIKPIKIFIPKLF